MLALIEQLLAWLRGGSLKLVTLAGIILLVWGTLSPVGTLVWWLTEGAESLGVRENKLRQQNKNALASRTHPKSLKINCYIVFLPGVGDFSADQLTPGEEVFLNSLVKARSNCVVVSDVFPYSAANESLGGERLLAPFWSFANEAEGWLGIADVLIKIRNLWRFAIAADDRYGPIYNRGIASAIIDRMNAAHPIPPSGGQPITIVLIGTSGGAQVALAAAPYLDEWLNDQIFVVSVGGVFTGAEGFNSSQAVYHLHGRQDWVDNLGKILFPSRWPVTVGSPFNQARRQERYVSFSSGPHEHDGATGYFGVQALPSGAKYVDLTFQKVNRLPIWSNKKLND